MSEITHLHTWKARFEQDLAQAYVVVHDSKYSFTINERSLLTIRGQIDNRLRDGMPGSAAWYYWVLDTNQDDICNFANAALPSEILGPYAGGNIVDHEQHYALWPLNLSKVLEPQSYPWSYTIIAIGTARSSLSTANGLIEMKTGSSEYQLTVQTLPATLVPTYSSAANN